MTEEEKENQGRRDEAQDPEREGGVGKRDEPPGQEDKPEEPEEEAPPEATQLPS
jgi:hypothetical protein